MGAVRDPLHNNCSPDRRGRFLHRLLHIHHGMVSQEDDLGGNLRISAVRDRMLVASARRHPPKLPRS